MGVEASSEEPEYKARLSAVKSLTPTSSQDDVDKAMAYLVMSLVHGTTPAQRREVIANLDAKVTSYKVNMSRNPKAMYIANEIGAALTSARNALKTPIGEDTGKFLGKYRSLIAKLESPKSE